MKGDFTRLTHAPVKHYTGMMLQQGRVQLDADFNEQDAIRREALRELARDVIGLHGGPADRLGFAIDPQPADSGEIPIGPGRYWVDGLLCVNPKPRSYRNQPDFFVQPDDKKLPPGTYLVYLDAWERAVSGIEDTATVERALNGFDTAVRVCLTWVVRVAPLVVGAGEAPSDAAAVLLEKLAVRDAGMQARLKTNKPNHDPCVTSPEARYRGNENQLYRIEVHYSSTQQDGPTFKWSRDNGSVTFPIDAFDGTIATVRGLGLDPRRDLKVGDWVEAVTDDLRRLEGTHPLLKVKNIDRNSGQVELHATPVGNFDKPATSHAFLRRWDQTERGKVDLSGGIPITDDWIPLEDGLEVLFSGNGATTTGSAKFASGDYWIVPARTTGDIEFPQDEQPPQGIVHRYAPLARITIDDGTFKVTRQDDFRKQFKALAVS